MKKTNPLVESICPFCKSGDGCSWANEIGFEVWRCASCSLLYLNPMLPNSETESAVRTGLHKSNSLDLNVRSRRSPKKVEYYKRVLISVFPKLSTGQNPIFWIDVGSGYGETLEAVRLIAPEGSRVLGMEPMTHKATVAKSLGLEVINDFLADSQFKADYISLIDIYSHVPDFWSLLRTLKSNLKEGGELFIESGNLADLKNRSEFPGELGLPDHLIFGGERHFTEYLRKEGFEVISIRRDRVDGIFTLAKNIVKKLIGRPVKLALPYTSNYRQLKIRARLPLMAGEIS